MIVYNAEKHEYTLDGKVVPSVTELAKQFSIPTLESIP